MNSPVTKVSPWIIWGALFFTQFLFPVVAWFSTRESEPQVLSLPSAVFYAMAGFSAIASFVIPKAVTPKNMEQSARTPSALSVRILQWALCESVSIYGLVFALLSGKAEAIIPFSSLALILFVLHRPRAS